MTSSHTWKRRDTVPISGTLKKDAVAKDIQGATLRFHMFKTDGTLIVDAAAVNDQVTDGSDGSKGKWLYSPTAADTDVSGSFYAEVEVTYSDDTVETFPNKTHIQVTITDDLA